MPTNRKRAWKDEDAEKFWDQRNSVTVVQDDKVITVNLYVLDIT